MKEVAKLAGVGVGTVSRVLNNGSVKSKTRVKVEEAMKVLNYQPNYYARGLKTNRTYSIALILPSIWHPFFAEFAFYVEHYLEERDYKLFLCNSNGHAQKEQEYIQMVKQNKVDGIIGITYSDIDEYISSNLPFVSIDRYFTEDVFYVTSDSQQGGQLAATELIKRGCKELAYIGGYQLTPNETKNRRKSFMAECATRKVTCHSLNMLEPLTHTRESIKKFIEANPGIDGIFAINDSMAIDVCETIELIGKKVPDDIQVIGYDGQRNRDGQPYLVSTIAQPIELMAKTAVELLIGVINDEEVPNRTVLPVTFGEGWSTKKTDYSNDN